MNATTDQFKAAYETNVFGVVWGTQAFIVLLKKSAEPGLQYYDYKGSVYLSSKSAMNMYTVVLAYELHRSNFKINAVCPGFIKTDFNGHHGTRSVEEAGKRIVKYALIGKGGPTGKFFSEENNPLTGEIPW